MTKIQTRVFNYGNECESDWPPVYGVARSEGSFVGYWDKETQTFKEGYPPNPNPKYGEAPYVIQDSIEPYKHPAAGVVVDSRSKLNMIDKVCGTITTDKMQSADSSWQRQRRAERLKDSHEALHKAVAQVDAGTAPLSEETRALCEARNAQVADALPGLDPFNAVGRVTNPKGKRFKKTKVKK